MYYRPTVNEKCNCKQTWTGEDALILNVSRGQCGKTMHLVTYNLMLNYTYAFTKQGCTLRGYLALHNRRLIDQYGVDPEKLLPFHIFKNAVFLF